MHGRQAFAAIVGSSFAASAPTGLALTPRVVTTRWGDVTLHRVGGLDRDAYLLFRHGLPHHLLPNQIPYRAHAAALREIGCRGLLVTSSVGVLDPNIPLFEPLLVDDLITLDNRLPDGSSCTMFVESGGDQGHLVLDEGLCSTLLSEHLHVIAAEAGSPVAARVTFGYVGGPRSKTAAENQMWRKLGAQVNSMTLGPEVVLANELEIPVAAVVVGHKYSLPSGEEGRGLEPVSIGESLDRSRQALERIVVEFLRKAPAVSFANSLHRFG